MRIGKIDVVHALLQQPMWFDRSTPGHPGAPPLAALLHLQPANARCRHWRTRLRAQASHAAGFRPCAGFRPYACICEGHERAETKAFARCCGSRPLALAGCCTSVGADGLLLKRTAYVRFSSKCLKATNTNVLSNEAGLCCCPADVTTHCRRLKRYYPGGRCAWRACVLPCLISADR